MAKENPDFDPEMYDEKAIIEYIAQHPDRYYSEFARTSTFGNIPRKVFDFYKAKVKSEKVKPRNPVKKAAFPRGLKHDGEAITKHIIEHPDQHYSEFVKKKEFKKVPRSVHRYYKDLLKKAGKISAKRKPYKRSTQKIYTSIWTGNSSQIGKEGMDAVSMLIEQLNDQKIINWEVVRLADPDAIEIRIPQK